MWLSWSGHLQDGQICSLGVVLGSLEGDIVGTSWGPIFAGWDDLDYHAVEFPLRGKDFSKIEEKKNIWINVLGYENRLTFSDLRFGSKIWQFNKCVDCNEWKQVTLCANQRFWQVYVSKKKKTKNKKYFWKRCL